MSTLVIHPRSAVRVRRGGPNGAVFATLQPTSRYLHKPLAVPVLARSRNGRWGKIRLPWRSDGATGWIALRGLRRSATDIHVSVDRAARKIDVWSGARLVARLRAGVGAPASPTPAGEYWITERLHVPASQRAAYGGFAYGLSGLQHNLPSGWRGNNQLAIHGTGATSSIGRAASAGCLRVSEHDLARIWRLLKPGTPVTIH